MTGKSPSQIGLFGGSFDPVHCGHLLLARAAWEEVSLDRMVFIPAARSPLKDNETLAPASDRLRLLKMALAGEPDWEVDDLEVKRGGISYTVDTLRHYRDRHPGATFHYFIGADNVPQLPLWREAETLATLASFLVIPRPGAPMHPLPHPFRGRYLEGFRMGVSSSEIRDRLKRGLSVRWMLPDSVEAEIQQNGLYL